VKSLVTALLVILFATPAPAEYFKYIDRNGIIFWVDDENKIPPQYRNQVANTSPEVKSVPEHAEPPVKPKQTTKLIIANNQIFVPVILVNKGRRVVARMILDTGASSTVIYPALAKKLSLHSNRVSMGFSKIADGSRVKSFITKIDFLQVDDSVLRNPEIVVMVGMSDMGADGLLGNSFLKYFHIGIDYDNQMLIWN